MPRNKIDYPVAIRLLKKFASDKEMEMIESGTLAAGGKTLSGKAKKVAVIGAGPAGLRRPLIWPDKAMR